MAHKTSSRLLHSWHSFASHESCSQLRLYLCCTVELWYPITSIPPLSGYFSQVVVDLALFFIEKVHVVQMLSQSVQHKYSCRAVLIEYLHLPTHNVQFSLLLFKNCFCLFFFLEWKMQQSTLIGFSSKGIVHFQIS